MLHCIVFGEEAITTIFTNLQLFEIDIEIVLVWAQKVHLVNSNQSKGKKLLNWSQRKWAVLCTSISYYINNIIANVVNALTSQYKTRFTLTFYA